MQGPLPDIGRVSKPAINQAPVSALLRSGACEALSKDVPASNDLPLQIGQRKFGMVVYLVPSIEEVWFVLLRMTVASWLNRI